MSWPCDTKSGGRVGWVVLRVTVFFSAAVVAGALPALATTIHVPGQQPTIQAGIDAASAGDTVLVACATYTGPLQVDPYDPDMDLTYLVMKSGVCLRGATGEAGCVIIDAQQQGRVLSCLDLSSATRIEGITFTGGAVDYGGGAMLWRDCYVTFSECAFTNNSATDFGGGVECQLGSDATFENCSFSGNSSVNGGGGMICTSSSATLSNCTFTGNAGGIWGGGLYWWTPTVGARLGGGQTAATRHGTAPDRGLDTIVDENGGSDGRGVRAPADGGGVVSRRPALGAGTNRFVGAMGHGAAQPSQRWVNGSRTWREGTRLALNLTDCAFLNNTSEAGAGFLCVGSSAAALAGCSFTENDADYGGGVYCMGTSPALVECIFTSNTAVNAGGGLGCQDNGVPMLTGCTFSENVAGFGGGVRLHTSSVTVTGCTVSSNTAANSGGGMQVYQGSVDMAASEFQGNTASSGWGGGVYMSAASTGEITGCTFDGNQCSGRGGGLYTGGGSLLVGACEFTENWGGFGGGGVACEGAGATLDGCTFTQNSSQYGGAVDCDDECSAALVDCVFESNSAEDLGGAVRCNHYSHVTVERCRFISNGESGGVTCRRCLLVRRLRRPVRELHVLHERVRSRWRRVL